MAFTHGKKEFRCSVIKIIFLLVLILPPGAAKGAERITLKFANQDPSSGFVSDAHKTWARELERRSGGRYNVEIAWSASMGPLEAHYDMVRHGIADVSFFTATPPAPFNFGMISTLPWNLPNPEISINAYWKLFKMGFFDKEFADVKPLFVWNGAGTALYSTKPINSLADLKGKKVATTIPYAIKFLKGIEATPVVIDPVEVYEAIEKGVIDACWFVWAAVIPFQLHEVCHYCIEPLFGNMQCAVAMNRYTYKKMPDDVKTIVEQLGENLLLPETIKGYQTADASGRKAFAEAGGVVTTWSQADLERMNKIISPYWETWIENMEKKDYPAREAVNAYWNILKEMGVEQPAFGYTPGN